MSRAHTNIYMHITVLCSNVLIYLRFLVISLYSFFITLRFYFSQHTCMLFLVSILIILFFPLCSLSPTGKTSRKCSLFLSGRLGSQELSLSSAQASLGHDGRFWIQAVHLRNSSSSMWCSAILRLVCLLCTIMFFI